MCLHKSLGFYKKIAVASVESLKIASVCLGSAELLSIKVHGEELDYLLARLGNYNWTILSVYIYNIMH